jgi:hypothetical protein
MRLMSLPAAAQSLLLGAQKEHALGDDEIARFEAREHGNAVAA